MLYTLSQSPDRIDSETLLALITHSDVILLWQDGVTLGIKNSVLLEQLMEKKIPVFALCNDIVARGLSPIYDAYVKQVDLENVVMLTAEHFPQFAW